MQFSTRTMKNYWQSLCISTFFVIHVLFGFVVYVIFAKVSNKFTWNHSRCC